MVGGSPCELEFEGREAIVLLLVHAIQAPIDHQYMDTHDPINLHVHQT